MTRLPSLRAILIALVALQIAVTTPITMATSSTAPPIASADCDGYYGTNDECPCCPESFPAPGGCDTLCLTAFAMPPPAALLSSQTALDALPGFGASAFASRTYPPVNPPPIR